MSIVEIALGMVLVCAGVIAIWVTTLSWAREKQGLAELRSAQPIEIGSRWISKDSGSPFQRDIIVQVIKKQDGWLLLESPDWPKGWKSDVREDSFRRCYCQVEDFQP